MSCFPRPLAISLAQTGPPQPQTAPPIFFYRCIHAHVYACRAVRLHPGAAVVVQHRSEAEARSRARTVSAIPPAVVHKRWAALMLAGVAMLHWFCTSALSTCGSVLLCSIVYYPSDGFYVLSVQYGLRSVQIKCCSIYGGQEQHGRACCEA